MKYRAVAVAVALALVWSPAVLRAQDTASAQDAVLTISAPSAEVYKGPSNVTPVIGHVPRGTAIPVLRNLGSWVKVAWPAGVDGVGYVRVAMGSLSPGTPASDATPSASSSAPFASTASTAGGQTIRTPPHTTPSDRTVVRSDDGSTISHVIGIGGAIGSMRSWGATGRAWAGNRLGVQVGFTRETLTSDVSPARVTSMQIEPAFVYGICDVVSDYVWFRPYVGSGLSIRHLTMHDAPAAAGEPSENGVGYRLFGGSELTFAGASRFALSVEAGYRRYPTTFEGFAADRFVASIAGHWYIK